MVLPDWLITEGLQVCHSGVCDSGLLSCAFKDLASDGERGRERWTFSVVGGLNEPRTSYM